MLESLVYTMNKQSMYVDARRSDDGKNRVNIYNRMCVRATLQHVQLTNLTLYPLI